PELVMPWYPAVGMSIVMIPGGIALAVGAMVALVGVSAAILPTQAVLSTEIMVLVAILAGLAVGTISGAFSGFLIARFSIPAFIVTLAMMTICRGVVFLITGGFTEGDLPARCGWLGRGPVWILPVPVVLL